MDFVLTSDGSEKKLTGRETMEKMVEGVDFLSIGKHCKEESCKQLDFLPFKCEHCREQFCVDHYESSKHNCQHLVDKDSRLPQCPLCMQYITKGTRGVDDNAQVERHIQSNCTSHVVPKKKPKKNRCSTSKCKQHSLIPFSCDKCFQQFCVRHRHPGDHNCLKPVSNLVLVK